jgi:hypothetical protein
MRSTPSVPQLLSLGSSLCMSRFRPSCMHLDLLLSMSSESMMYVRTSFNDIHFGTEGVHVMQNFHVAICCEHTWILIPASSAFPNRSSTRLMSSCNCSYEMTIFRPLLMWTSEDLCSRSSSEHVPYRRIQQNIVDLLQESQWRKKNWLKTCLTDMLSQPSKCCKKECPTALVREACTTFNRLKFEDIIKVSFS